LVQLSFDLDLFPTLVCVLQPRPQQDKLLRWDRNGFCFTTATGTGRFEWPMSASGVRRDWLTVDN